MTEIKTHEGRGFKLTMQKTCDVWQVKVTLFPEACFEGNFKSVINIMFGGKISITKQQYMKGTNAHSFGHLYAILHQEEREKMDKETNPSKKVALQFNCLGFAMDKDPQELTCDTNSKVADHIIASLESSLKSNKTFCTYAACYEAESGAGEIFYKLKMM